MFFFETDHFILFIVGVLALPASWSHFLSTGKPLHHLIAIGSNNVVKACYTLIFAGNKTKKQSTAALVVVAATTFLSLLLI